MTTHHHLDSHLVAQVITEKRRILAYRQIQHARLGIFCSPDIVLEMEDLEHEIEILEKSISGLTEGIDAKETTDIVKKHVTSRTLNTISDGIRGNANVIIIIPACSIAFYLLTGSIIVAVYVCFILSLGVFMYKVSKRFHIPWFGMGITLLILSPIKFIFQILLLGAILHIPVVGGAQAIEYFLKGSFSVQEALPCLKNGQPGHVSDSGSDCILDPFATPSEGVNLPTKTNQNTQENPAIPDTRQNRALG